MRRRVLASLAKSGYTAKDYVQDGLVAMWDGIENAGWGIHDPNATVWKDCVSGIEFGDGLKYDGAAYYNEANALTYVTATLQALASASTVHLETALRVDSYSYNNTAFAPYVRAGIIAFGPGWSGDEYKWGTSWNYATGGEKHQYSIPSSFFLSGGTLSASVVDDGRAAPPSLYFNAILQSGTVIFETNVKDKTTVEIQGDTYDRMVIRRKLHSVRVYSRALSASEVAANNTVDKARFNFPDVT